MTNFEAYGCWWSPFNLYQGWVVGPFNVGGEEVRLVQTIRTASTLDELKNELGLFSTDKDWQLNASRSGLWQVEWGGVVDIVHMFEGVEKPILDRPLIIDPGLGLPVDRYWGAEQYRDALPVVVWKFNPWTGEYRKSQDINNDPMGLLL